MIISNTSGADEAHALVEVATTHDFELSQNGSGVFALQLSYDLAATEAMGFTPIDVVVGDVPEGFLGTLNVIIAEGPAENATATPAFDINCTCIGLPIIGPTATGNGTTIAFASGVVGIGGQFNVVPVAVGFVTAFGRSSTVRPAASLDKLVKAQFAWTTPRAVTLESFSLTLLLSIPSASPGTSVVFSAEIQVAPPPPAPSNFVPTALSSTLAVTAPLVTPTDFVLGPAVASVPVAAGARVALVVTVSTAGTGSAVVRAAWSGGLLVV